MRTRIAQTALALGALVGLLVAGEAVPASAAGSGYGPGTPPPSASAGGFTQVVAAHTLSAGGGVLTGRAFGTTVTVRLPRGAVSRKVEVVLSAARARSLHPGKGLTVVAAFSVALLNPNTGAKLRGPFSPALTITLVNAAIHRGDFVVDLTSVGHSHTVASTVTRGRAVVKVTRDPNLAVVRR